jgi:hypothetical protein
VDGAGRSGPLVRAPKAAMVAKHAAVTTTAASPMTAARECRRCLSAGRPGSVVSGGLGSGAPGDWASGMSGKLGPGASGGWASVMSGL